MVMPRVYLGLIGVVSILLAFDFKGQESGGLYQISAYLISLGFLTIAMLIGLRRAPTTSIPKGVGLSLVLWLYLGTTVFSTLVHNVPMSNYQVMLAPYILFAMAFTATLILGRRFTPIGLAAAFFPIFKLMLIVSVMWTLFYGSTQADVTALDVRYRLISTLVPFAYAYLASAYFSGQLRRLDWVILVMVSAITIASQTRGYAGNIAVAVMLAIFGHSRTNISAAIRAGKSLCALIVLYMGAALLASLILGAFFGGDYDLTAMWVDRFIGSSEKFGFDLTYATRVAEYTSQWERLSESPLNMLIGCGLGAPYTYAGEYADRLAETIGLQNIPESYWAGGHSLWVYTIYASGFLFGGLMLAFLAVLVARCFQSIRRARRLAPEARHLVVSYAATFLCFIATGFTAFPLGNRPIAFLMGVTGALGASFVLRSNPNPLRGTAA